MFFIDTHCHLNYKSFQENLKQVVDRAADVGVIQIVVPGFDLESSLNACKIASSFSNVYAAVGIHPNDVAQYDHAQLEEIEGLAKESKVVAIGEIGLDFFHHPEEKENQLKVLDAMLDLAKRLEKPVILHSRNSAQELFEVVQAWRNGQPANSTDTGGIFHSFEGDVSQARMVQGLNMFLGIGGPITFKKALLKQEVVKQLGLNSVVLETDSPFLSPHPFRGEINEPSRIPFIAQKIADLLELTTEQVAQVTTRNAQLLFRLDRIS